MQFISAKETITKKDHQTVIKKPLILKKGCLIGQPFFFNILLAASYNFEELLHNLQMPGFPLG